MLDQLNYVRKDQDVYFIVASFFVLKILLCVNNVFYNNGIWFCCEIIIQSVTEYREKIVSII